MALTDPYLSFSSVIWFLATFINFFNFVISNKNFLGILKNLKFRKKKILKSLILINILSDLSLVLVHTFLQKWLQKWSKLLSELIKKL